METMTNPQGVAKILRGEQLLTRKGYTFSYCPLSEEDLGKICDMLPKEKKQGKPKRLNSASREIGKLSFEVASHTQSIFFIPRRKDEVKAEIMLLYSKALDKDNKSSSTSKTLKREFLRELLESL